MTQPDRSGKLGSPAARLRIAVMIAAAVAVIVAVGGCSQSQSGSASQPAPPSASEPTPEPTANCPAPQEAGSHISTAPSTSRIGLAGWQLSIPVDNSKGDATTVDHAALVAPWLTDAPGGGLMFWAPTCGATTKHSDHPRTELDSLTNFGAGTGTHTLTAALSITQQPQDGRGIIVGQIHGASDISSVPYVMVRFQDNQLRVVVKQVQQGTALINYPLLANIQLNVPFSYTITDLGNGTMQFTATQNGDTHQATAPVPSAFSGETVRFQAGDYQQSLDPAGPQDGGRVVFTNLTEHN